MATNDDEEEHQDEKEEMETTVREIHSFVRFVSIRIFCVMPLHGRNFLAARAQYRHRDVYRKKHNQRAPFVSFFIKIAAPIPHLSFQRFFYLSPAGLDKRTLLR